MRPAWYDVPQAMTYTRSIRLSSSSVRSSSSMDSAPFTRRPASVSRITRGCSWISFNMKSG